jgi:hypothetical protein
MITRSSSRTVVFTHPFCLSAFDTPQPSGSYVVETDEELIQELSFPAYRRTGVWLRLPPPPGSGALDRVVNIDPAELDATLAGDVVLSSSDGRATRLVGANDPASDKELRQ